MGDKDKAWRILRTKWLELREDFEILLRPGDDLSAVVRDEELSEMQGWLGNARQRLREQSGG